MNTETLLLMQENFNNIAEKLNSLGGVRTDITGFRWKYSWITI